MEIVTEVTLVCIVLLLWELIKCRADRSAKKMASRVVKSWLTPEIPQTQQNYTKNIMSV